MPLGNPIRKQNESRMVSVLATEGQTVFTVQGGYIINQLSVFRNGVRLSNAEDFTAGDGSTVTLNNAANIDDRIEFHIFDRFTVQNAIVGAASSQTISGDLVVNGKVFGNLDVPSVNTGIVTATNLNITGISTFGNVDFSNLDISGITTVAGSTDLNGNLSVAGVSTFTGLIDVNGGAHIDNLRLGIEANNDITTSSGNLTLDSANGNVIINDNLDVDGTTTLDGLVSIATSIVHTGDVNTSIGFSAADTIDLKTGGTERLRIDTNKVMFSADAKVDNHNVRDLGTSENRWKSLYLGTDLNVAGVSTFANTVISGVTTHSNDVVFTGDNYNLQWDKSNDRLEFLDNTKALFGTSGDLQIYHSGSHSFMQHNGTGHLIIGGVPNGTNVDIMKAGYSEYMARFKPDSSVDLYYDANVRFQTTPSGADVTGTLNVTGISTVKTEVNATGVGDPIVEIRNTRLNTGAGAAGLRFITNEIGGSNQYGRAQISAEYDGASNVSGRLIFSTANGSGTLTERVRIEDSGQVNFTSTDSLKIPVGTTGERPSGVDGMIRFNSTLSQTEEYRDSGWFGLSNKSTVTGGTITTSGSYTIHTFTSSGTLTVSGSTKTGVDFLVVSGGAGGGGTRGGGGGAGGMVESTDQDLVAGSYTITVGGGGAAGTGTNSGGAGGASSLGSVQATVGGGTGGGQGTAGGNGGSGGGGSDGLGGGSGTSGQGNNGGGSTGGTGGGGGGGKDGAGNQSGNQAGGNGGAAGASALSGSTVNYSGGGGGGSRDNYSGGNGGGGGAGSGGKTTGANASAASANQGGGGGGGGRHSAGDSAHKNGAAGGSGIVIVRYLT